MIEALYQGFQAALLITDIQAALTLLQEHRSDFLEPFEGGLLHAKILYLALKHPNADILNFLLNLQVFSDISFFRYCGQTPLSLALEDGHVELASLLAAKTDKNFALQMAVKCKMEKTTHFLLSHCKFKAQFLKMLGLN